MAESHAGASDAAVLKLARQSGRMLLTEDRDFGFLVWAAHAQSNGVVYLRYRQSERHTIARAVVEFVKNRPEVLAGHFVVIEPGRIRIRRPPV